MEEMERSRENVRYLPGVKLGENVRFCGDDAALFDVGTGNEVSLIIGAVPTQYLRAAFERLKAHVPAGVPVVSVAKGIEIGTLKRPTEIILEVLDGPEGAGAGVGDARERRRGRDVAALSGPSIAGELARRLPATMVVAGRARQPNAETRDPAGPGDAALEAAGEADGGGGEGGAELAKWVQELFTTPYLRVYRNEDLVGVELAGALKNVVAVAAGMLDGMRAGNNAKAALLTRGLVEMTRFGVALGGRAETFIGLAGLGDLVTTCVSPEGRNRSFGERVGRGEKAPDALAAMVGVVEGVPTCKAVVHQARGRNIDMPICEGLYGVLFEGKEIKGAIAELMARELKSE